LFSFQKIVKQASEAAKYEPGYRRSPERPLLVGFYTAKACQESRKSHIPSSYSQGRRIKKTPLPAAEKEKIIHNIEMPLLFIARSRLWH